MKHPPPTRLVWGWVALCLALAAVSAHLFSRYCEVIQGARDVYVLQPTSGRVWQIRQVFVATPDASVWDYLAPGGLPLTFVPSASEAQEIGRVEAPGTTATCAAPRQPAQQACFTYTDDGEIVSWLLDIAPDRAVPAVPTWTPLSDLINAVRATVTASGEDPAAFQVIPARAARVQHPPDSAANWWLEPLGAVVVFKGQAARAFEVMAGIGSTGASLHRP